MGGQVKARHSHQQHHQPRPRRQPRAQPGAAAAHLLVLARVFIGTRGVGWIEHLSAAPLWLGPHGWESGGTAAGTRLRMASVALGGAAAPARLSSQVSGRAAFHPHVHWAGYD